MAGSMERTLALEGQSALVSQADISGGGGENSCPLDYFSTDDL